MFCHYWFKFNFFSTQGRRHPYLIQFCRYHFSHDIAVFVNIADSQLWVSQQSNVQSIAWGQPPIKRQNFNGLQILKHLIREQLEHLALYEALYEDAHFGSTRITELEVIATPAWNFLIEKYINRACCNASNLESNFDLYNAELNPTMRRAQRRSNFGNSQQFVCDVLSSVTETPLTCQERPSWVLKMVVRQITGFYC